MDKRTDNILSAELGPPPPYVSEHEYRHGSFTKINNTGEFQ